VNPSQVVQDHDRGAELFIAEGTVKFHRNHILKEVGANAALKRGLANLD
jgi:hypothetical protein